MSSTEENISVQAESHLETVWVNGLTFDASGNVIGGFTDVNLNGKEDSSMSWAASASNVLAWWQQQYGMADSASGEVPLSAEDIYATFLANWSNAKASADYGFLWWISGNSQSSSSDFGYLCQNYYIGTGEDGGYYSSDYPLKSISSYEENNGLTFTVYDSSGTSADDFASSIVNSIRQGRGISLQLGTIYSCRNAFYERDITVWGATYDTETGELVSISVTDPKDGKDGLVTLYLKYEASRDSFRGHYRVLNSDYMGLYLMTHTPLSAGEVDDTAPPAPTNVQAVVQGNQVTLTWDGGGNDDIVYYHLHLYSADWYDREVYFNRSYSSMSESKTITLPYSDTIRWYVYATDSAGNNSGNAAGNTFTVSIPFEMELEAPILRKTADGQYLAIFEWLSTELSTYELYLDGNLIYQGNNLGYSCTVTEGEHTLKLTATDSSGTLWQDSLTFTGAETPPAAPTNLQAQLEGNILTLSWDAAPVSDTISYVLNFTAQNPYKYTNVWRVTENSYSIVLEEANTYSWSVCVEDSVFVSGSGWLSLRSEYARGESVTYSPASAEIRFLDPVMEKTGEGQMRVTFGWSSDAETTYTLEIDGERVYSGTDAQFSITLADGEHSYSVTATDGEGNSAVYSDSFTCDTLAPELSLNTPTQKAATSGHVKVSFSWSSDEAATYKLTVNGKTYDVGTATQYTVTLPDGSYSYTVTATDNFGNICAMETDFFCDITAPESPSYLRVQVKEGAALFSWSGVQDVSGVTYTLAYRLKGSSSYRYVAVADNSAQMELPFEGNYEWQLRAEDGAGNASAWVSGSDFSYDVTGPKLRLSKPTLSKAAEGMVKITLAWETNESGVSYELVVNGESVYSGTKSSYVLTLPDGEYSYSVIAADASGNKTTKTSSFICDMAAPVLSNLQSEIGEDGSVTLSWACSEAAEYVIKLGKETFYPGSETSYSLKLKDGKYSYTITATDGSGLKGTAKGSFVVDTIAPKIAFKEPKYKNLGNGLVQASLSWKGESKASYTLLVDGEEAYSGTKTSCKLTLAEGSHSYTLIATDAAGNQSETPALTLSAPAWEKNAEGQIAASFSWVGEAGSSYLLTVDGKKYNVSGTSYELALKDGKHKYSLTATDAAGNSSVLAGEFVADAKAPKLSLSKPKAAKPVDGLTAVQLKWSAEKGAHCVLTVAGQSYQLEGKSYTVSLGHGEHEYSITATDAAGNTSVQTSVISVDGLAPEVTLGKAETVSVKKGKVQLTLSWVGEDGASYTLMGGSKKAYSGKKATCKLTLNEGVYNYNLLATDKAGNTSTLETQLVVDATGQVSWSTLDSELTLSAGSYALPVDAACAPASLAELALQEQKTGLGMLA